MFVSPECGCCCMGKLLLVETEVGIVGLTTVTLMLFAQQMLDAVL